MGLDPQRIVRRIVKRLMDVVVDLVGWALDWPWWRRKAADWWVRWKTR